MALDSTIGGENSNSWVSLIEADAYFAAHYSAAAATSWSALSDTQKESALKRACQVVDSLNFLDDHFRYRDTLPEALRWDEPSDLTLCKYYDYQRLQIPRNIDEDSSGVVFIPGNFKDAQCEQAVYLLSFDPTNMIARMSGVKYERVKAGQVEIEQAFTNGVIGDSTHLAPMAIELVSEFIRRGTRVQRA